MLVPVRTIAPSETPVTLALAKSHLTVDFDGDDDLITAFIQAAVSHLDGYNGVLGRAMVSQQWQQQYDTFECLPPLAVRDYLSVVSVQYFDSSNTLQTLDTSVYQVLTNQLGSFLCLKVDQDWPDIYRREDAVTVTYLAGFGDVAAVPGAIKQAILMMVAHWYENRETTSGFNIEEIPFGAGILIGQYRRVCV